MKRVLISAGPIPSKLDSVKYVTNRFHGGLAFKCASFLRDECGFDVTLVVWKYLQIPQSIKDRFDVIYVEDVREYFDFLNRRLPFDGFILSAAVANLMPKNPWEGKFPSHEYKVGDSIPIDFEIAPRAIDTIKKNNPRSCLIGYKLFDTDSDIELTDIARHTLEDSRANIIFANRPSEAKTRKIAITPDGAAIPVDFDEHLEMIRKAINARYFRTELDEEADDLDISHAKNIVRVFESTFDEHGTVAIPCHGGFATTSRGHRGDPVFVRECDFDKKIVYASGKATLNAPLLSELTTIFPGSIIVHRHDDDPNFSKRPVDLEIPDYLFPGTLEEVRGICQRIYDKGLDGVRGEIRIKLAHHGDIRILPIQTVDWSLYYDQFPERYFGVNEALRKVIDSFSGKESLDIGCNVNCDGKYAYDPYMNLPNNLTIEDIRNMHFDVAFAKNSINYLSDVEIRTILDSSDKFIANTFLRPPAEKVSGNEAVTKYDGLMHHTLRLRDDNIISHTFYAREITDWKNFGLTVTTYGNNSCLLTKEIY